MRYLKRTKDYMLIYKHVQDLQLVGYSDSDFAGYQDEKKSTTGYKSIYILQTSEEKQTQGS